MTRTAKIVRLLSELSIKEIDVVATGLVWYDQCLAERLANAISFQQQERDRKELARYDALIKARHLESFDGVSSR